MDWGLISGLRKLLAYVRGLFPERAAPDTAPGPLARLKARLDASPRYLRVRNFVRGTALYNAAAILVRCFLWKDLRGEQVSLSSLPSDVRPLLRNGLAFVALALLCILVGGPVRWPPIDVAGLGFETDVLSALTHYLALLGIAFGWAALLTGAARSNPWMFVFTGSVFVYSLLPVGTSPAGNPQAGLLAVALLIALRHGGPFLGLRPRWRAVLLAAVGLCFSIGYRLLIRLRTLPDEAALALVVAPLLVAAVVLLRARGTRAAAQTLGRALLLAVTVRLAAFVVASLFSWELSPPSLWPALCDLCCITAFLPLGERLVPARCAASPGRTAALIFGVLALYLAIAQALTSQRELFSWLAHHLAYYDSVLWLVWYFIGVGIVFKLLQETKALSRAMDALLPGRLFPVLGLGALAAVLLLGFTPELLVQLASWWPDAGWLLDVHRGYQEFVHGPSTRETLAASRWVLLFVGGLLLYLRARGLLDRARALPIAFITILVCWAIVEYHAEFFAFGKAGSTSRGLLAAFVFGVWIVWLCYSVGMGAATGDSPTWPRAGRTGLFVGAFILFATLFHTGVITSPKNLSNRTYLQLFLGVLHLGLPYFLYIYLRRRYRDARVSVERLAGAFALGLCAAIPLLLLEKLALGGYTLEGFAAVARRIADALATTGAMPPELRAPTDLPYLAMLVGAGLCLRGGALAVVGAHPLSTLAVFLGFGAAQVMPLWLPMLPGTALATLQPLHVPLSITRELILHHATHLIVALVVAHGVLGGRRRLLLALGFGGCCELGLRWLASRGDVEVASCEVWPHVLLGCAAVALLLFWRLEARLAPSFIAPASLPLPLASESITAGDVEVAAAPADVPSAIAAEPPIAPPVLAPPRHVLAFSAALALALAGSLAARLWEQRMAPVSIGGLTVAVPARWSLRGTHNTGTQNTGTQNTATQNTGTQNTGTQNTGTQNTGTQNTGTQNTGTQNTGTQNTGTQNTGTQNTGTQNTGTQNTGTQNTGTQNTGTQNTGAPVTSALWARSDDGSAAFLMLGLEALGDDTTFEQFRAGKDTLARRTYPDLRWLRSYERGGNQWREGTLSLAPRPGAAPEPRALAEACRVLSSPRRVVCWGLLAEPTLSFSRLLPDLRRAATYAP